MKCNKRNKKVIAGRDDYFDPSFGNRPQNLIGRNKYINEFKNTLETRPGSRERSILLLGQRGYGKTVMLLEMADIAGQNGYIVASPTVTSPELTNRILECKLTGMGLGDENAFASVVWM